jgi:hypothetical protein
MSGFSDDRHYGTSGQSIKLLSRKIWWEILAYSVFWNFDIR